MNAIRCGLQPGESRAVVQGINEPLRLCLERNLDRPVEMVVGHSFAATGEALRRGQLDIAYLGPVTYILQSRNTGLEPFARASHGYGIGPTFQSAIIVPANSPAASLADLRGAEFAMGDLVSTSGSWVPRYMLMESGLLLGADYTRRMLGTHEAVAGSVARGEVAAGGISLPVYQRLLAEGLLEADATRVLVVSPPIPEYMWTFRAGLSRDLREALRNAFMSLRNQDVLRAYHAEAFIPAVDADVDRVRHWMEGVLQARLSYSCQPMVAEENVVSIPAEQAAR